MSIENLIMYYLLAALLASIVLLVTFVVLDLTDLKTKYKHELPNSKEVNADLHRICVRVIVFLFIITVSIAITLTFLVD